MAWRLAKSLQVLRDQVNALAPNRDKSSDGAVGDEAHASRSSDHNPYIQDPPGPPVVSAIDITNDPAHFDSHAFAEMLRETKDGRVKYVISNRKIFSAIEDPWHWRNYNGKNPHDHHVHISVKSDKDHFDDVRPWVIASMPTLAPHPEIHIVRRPTLKFGSNGDAVAELQRLLGIVVDSEFGPITKTAVEQCQRKAGLVVDGIVGRYTWDALRA